MKPLVNAVLGLALTVPVIPFAQTSGQPLTRAQVRADTLRAEMAGYSPTAWAYFPYGEMQAAQFRVAARKASDGAIEETTGGSGQRGMPLSGDIAR